MMKKLTSMKLVPMLVIALFMFFFAGSAVAEESQEIEVKKMTGMISDIMPDIGNVTVVENESGNAVTLTAGTNVDLKSFNVGDHVMVEYSDEMTIISITKKTE